MTIKYTFDIKTKQTVYAVCEKDVCVMLTTNLVTAMNKVKTM